MGKRERTVNRSQVLVPFGVGGIFDYEGESLIGCDASYWGTGGVLVESPRLASHLSGRGVTSFRSAYRKNPVPYVRFPRWVFCPTCRRMRKLKPSNESVGEPPRCQNPACTRHPVLVPMRFVMACPEGHVSDIPWDWWAHSIAGGTGGRCKSRDLAFETIAGRGTGLDSIRIRCLQCDSSRDLKGITAKGALARANVRCSGTQPWQRPARDRACNADPTELVALQRGAGNLYFASVVSALDIPPHSDFDPNSELARIVKMNSYFPALVSAPDNPVADSLKELLIADLTAMGYSLDVPQLDLIIDREVNARTGRIQGPYADPDDLLLGEWNAFVTPRVRLADERDSFITESVPVAESDEASQISRRLGDQVAQVVLCHRLREVRALLGFRRVTPEGTLVDSRLDHAAKISWIPAIEAKGEGIFIQLSEARVAAWEATEAVRTRFREILARADSLPLDTVPEVTPRFVLLHTLSHALMRQLTFSIGYPLSSMSERVYSRSPGDEVLPQAGVLVYTAQGDLEGTMGGLVRGGRPPYFADSLVKSIARAAWCSSDPVCADSEGQGLGALNLAACHACTLIPETSCRHRNLLLDRMLLVHSEFGFFRELLDDAFSQSVMDSGP